MMKAFYENGRDSQKLSYLKSWESMESIWIIWKQSLTINTTRRIIQRSIRILERTRSLHSLWKKHTGMNSSDGWCGIQSQWKQVCSVAWCTEYGKESKYADWFMVNDWSNIKKKQIHEMKDFILSHSWHMPNSIQTTKKICENWGLKIWQHWCWWNRFDVEMKFHTGFKTNSWAREKH